MGEYDGHGQKKIGKGKEWRNAGTSSPNALENVLPYTRMEGELAVSPPIIEPRSTANSAGSGSQDKARIDGLLHLFSRQRPSREQQHWTLGLPGAPFGSHDCFVASDGNNSL